MTLTTPQIHLDTTAPDTRPTDYRALIRARHTLPTPDLTSAFATLFDEIDLTTLAARGVRLARRAATDTTAAAELEAISTVLAATVAAPAAERLITTALTLHHRPEHTYRTGAELLMLAYCDLLTDPAVVNAPPLRTAH